MSLNSEQVCWFDSAETGAPTYSNTAGAWLTVLRACLVNGFDVRAVTDITVASGVATATVPSHAFVTTAGKLVEIRGSAVSALNGAKQLSAVASNTITYLATGVADGVYSGSISARRAPLGWVEPFASGNVAVFRPSDLSASGAYLRVDDSAGLDAWVRAYEMMSDASTGTNPAPTVAQATNGLSNFKSYLSGTRTWALVGDARGFYFISDANLEEHCNVLYFGDVVSRVPIHTFGFFVSGNLTASSGDEGNVSQSSKTLLNSQYLLRSGSGSPGSVAVRVQGDMHVQSSATAFSGESNYGFGTYPLPPNNAFQISHVNLIETANYSSGLPGGYHIATSGIGVVASKTMVGAPQNLPGRMLMLHRTGNRNTSGAATGAMAFDVTGPWER